MLYVLFGIIGALCFIVGYIRMGCKSDIDLAGIDVAVPIVGIALFFFCAIAAYVSGIHYNTGQGTHLGYVSSAETTGIFFKTPRVYFKTSLRSSQEDKYCVENMTLYNKLSALQNKNVVITYKSYLVNGMKVCAGESAVITDFKVIKN